MADSPASLPSLGLLGGLGVSARILTAAGGTYAITGQSAGGPLGYVVIAATGDYGLSGQVAVLLPSLGRSGDPASLPHLGLLLAPSTVTRTLVCDAGIYIITGSDAVIDQEIAAAQGSYTISGQNANLFAARVIAAGTGAYSITGQDVSFTRSGSALVLTADSGLYSIDGTEAPLLAARSISLEQGFYAVGGNAAALSFGLGSTYLMVADGGTYAVSGQDAVVGLALIADTGLYEIGGEQAWRVPDALIYIPIRQWVRTTRVGVEEATDQRNLRSWMPPSNVPLVDKEGRINEQWRRFIDYVANYKLGGPDGPALSDVAATLETTQELANEAATTASALQQVVVNNAEVLSAAAEVLQDNAIPGSEQLPPIRRYLRD